MQRDGRELMGAPATDPKFLASKREPLSDRLAEIDNASTICVNRHVESDNVKAEQI